DLDDLAKYVQSLNKIPDSPYKNTDGSLTADAKLGEKLFLTKGCNDCHSGAFFTDSAKNNLHNIGTLKTTSGKRLGEQLTGISTPTLKGLWMTAPYLHDGSANTLQDAIKVMRNKANHPITTTAQERDYLAAYLMQIDSNTLQPRSDSNNNDNHDDDNIDNPNPSSNKSGGGSLPPIYLFLMLLITWFRFNLLHAKHSLQ
ncbi:MAG TPA: c-type cytochrome, partial [Leucothrix mucor]|nr:c-type cytochrome [Leucothrix mucor]